MTSRARADRRMLMTAAVAVVVLAAGSTVAIAAANGAFGNQHGPVASRCTPSALPGTVIDVSLVDMHGTGGMMRGGQSDWRTWRAGMMRVVANTHTAPHGTVSFLVTNTGAIRHELVVLPLTGNQASGAFPVGPDGRVGEAGRVTEASADCTAGTGDGITPGASGWTTVSLPAGRYEVFCNLSGHYTAGMYTELDIT